MVDSAIQNPYDSLARIYRELIRVTGRLQAEINLANRLFQRLGIDKNSRILDFACGTGDVLAGLSELGYLNLFGTDGSLGMLARANKLQNIKYTHVVWNDFRSYFADHAPFDCAFALSISLPHVMETDLSRVLTFLRLGLKEGGILIFDFRDWLFSHEGRLREADRPENVQRWLSEVMVDGSVYLVDDLCTYDETRQYVTYRISKQNKNGLGWDRQSSSTVSYALIEKTQFVKVVCEAGFGDVEINLPDGWPYLVLTARAIHPLKHTKRML